MASLYERIDKNTTKVPDCFDLRISQLYDLIGRAPGVSDMLYTAFKFGYLQGVRAERAGKAGVQHE